MYKENAVNTQNAFILSELIASTACSRYSISHGIYTWIWYPLFYCGDIKGSGQDCSNSSYRSLTLSHLYHQLSDSSDRLFNILQGCFTGTGAIIWLPQCPWSNPAGYGWISTYNEQQTMWIFHEAYHTTQDIGVHPVVLSQSCITQQIVT